MAAPAHTLAISVAPQLADIRGPLPVEPGFPYTGGLLLLGIALGLVLRRRRKHTPKVPPVEPVAADAQAMLARLAGEYRQGACSAGTCLLRLDTLLRGAVPEGESVGVSARHLTTAEWQRSAAPHLSAAAQAELGELLALFDAIKFARAAPSAAQAERALEIAARLLAATP